jgi:outer membrane protein
MAMKQRMLGWLMAGLAFSAPALAEIKIGYVDVRAVLADSKTGKAHRAGIEKYVKDKQAEIRKEEEKLNTLKQSLEKEALTLSDAQKQQKQKDFQDKVQALQKTAQDADRELRQKDGEFTNKSIDVIRQVIADLAKAEGVNMVLGRGEVLYGDDSMDLTAKVIEKFDAAVAKGGDGKGDDKGAGKKKK